MEEEVYVPAGGDCVEYLHITITFNSMSSRTASSATQKGFENSFNMHSNGWEIFKELVKFCGQQCELIHILPHFSQMLILTFGNRRVWKCASTKTGGL